MSCIWSNNLKLTIFGESHGEGVGIVIDGIPAGIEIDKEFINSEMQRRAPGKNKYSTSRKEADEFEILSGCFNGFTTGMPICVFIRNTNKRSRDYSKIKDVIRPGHADYTAFIKYRGFNDYRGGGHFSGRLTAPIVFAGALCKQILFDEGITIGSHIKKIHTIEDEEFDYININSNILNEVIKKEFPVIDEIKGEKMKAVIVEAKEKCDSVGGIIECAAVNIPAGLGEPFFDSIESKLGHILFSIPSVKGVEFGKGFSFSHMMGTEANDEYCMVDNNIKTITNNNGGILGGITNGMPLIFKVAIKPTPSIGVQQKTINVKENTECNLEVQGRHDPCIVLRALPVIESAASIVILDSILERNKELCQN